MAFIATRSCSLEQPGLGQAEEGGQHEAVGQVPGGPEEHEHCWLRHQAVIGHERSPPALRAPGAPRASSVLPGSGRLPSARHEPGTAHSTRPLASRRLLTGSATAAVALVLTSPLSARRAPRCPLGHHSRLGQARPVRHPHDAHGRTVCLQTARQGGTEGGQAAWCWRAGAQYPVEATRARAWDDRRKKGLRQRSRTKSSLSLG